MLVSDLVVADTDSEIVITCYDIDNRIIDLTTATGVEVRWRIGKETFVVKTMTILSPATDGRARYRFTSTDLNISGIMQIEFTITFPPAPFFDATVSSAEIRILSVRDNLA